MDFSEPFEKPHPIPRLAAKRTGWMDSLRPRLHRISLISNHTSIQVVCDFVGNI